MKKLKELFLKWFYSRVNGWYSLSVISFFIGVVLLIQTSQYVSEKTGTGVWLVSGILFLLLGAFLMWKGNKTSGGHSG